MNLKSICPWCAKRNDGVSDTLGTANPQAGDVTMCVSCGGWSIFEDHLTLRRPSEEEWIDISGMDEVKRVSQHWLQISKTKN